jgi:hypothetical protein
MTLALSIAEKVGSTGAFNMSVRSSRSRVSRTAAFSRNSGSASRLSTRAKKPFVSMNCT